MQNNTLYVDKVLFCIELYTRDNNNKENKKVSDKKEQVKFWVELPSKEFQNQFQILAKEKGLNQKSLMEKILYEYLIHKETNRRKMTRELEEAKEKYKIDFNKDTKDQIIQKIKMVLAEHLNIMRKYDPDEAKKFIDYLENYEPNKK